MLEFKPITLEANKDIIEYDKYYKQLLPSNQPTCG